MKILEEMKQYIKDNNFAHLVRELNFEGTPESLASAIEYVYDQHTMTKEQFIDKYLK